MARKRCRSCLGEYDDLQPDGLRYFHRCAPIPRVRVRLLNGNILLFESRMTVEETVDVDGTITRTATFDPLLPPGATFLEIVYVERANLRDENVIPDPNGGPGRVRADGGGVVEL